MDESEIMNLSVLKVWKRPQLNVGSAGFFVCRGLKARSFVTVT